MDNTAETEVIEQVEQEVEQAEPEIEQESTEQQEQQTEPEQETQAETPSAEMEGLKAPEWVRQLRKEHKELKRKNAEYERQLQTQAPSVPVVMREPQLSDPDIDYDTDIFKQKMLNYLKSQEEVQRAELQKKQQQENAAKEWAAKIESFNQGKKTLGVPLDEVNYAQDIVESLLDEQQQGVILHVTNNPAKVVYELGRNTAKLKELQAIKDPLKLAAELAKVELSASAPQRKPATQPEKRVGGSGNVASVDAQLEALRAEAAKTGDMSKVFAYKAQLRKKTT